MSSRLADTAAERGMAYVARQVPVRPHSVNRGPEPQIDAEASVVDCALGRWTRVGARTQLSEVAFGDYSYIVSDSSATYADIGKFCSIARDVRINPGNHPTWRAAQHHFSYRAISYDLADNDDADFFEWRRADRVVMGHDIWIGHGGGVETDLICPRQKQGAHVVVAAHTATDGQGHEALLGGAGDQIKHRATVFVGGVDVQKAQLVRTCRIIGARGFHWIARIDEVGKVHALDHTAIGDIKAGDEAGFQHEALIIKTPARAKPLRLL